MKSPEEKNVQLWIILISAQVIFDIMMIGLLDYNRAMVTECAKRNQAMLTQIGTEIDTLSEARRNLSFDAAVYSLNSAKMAGAMRKAADFYQDLGLTDKAKTYRFTADNLLKPIEQVP